MTLLKWSASFLILVLLASCATDSNPGPNPPPTNPPTGQPDIAGNNSAVLTGAPLGSGETDVQQLRKEVPVDLITASSDFELGTFSATRPSTDTQALYWILPITNVSDEVRCFVKAVNLTFSDDANSQLALDSQAFVDGSVGVLSSVYTNTCIASQETGYLRGIETDNNVDVYSLLESVEIETIEVNAGTPSTPQVEVIPQRYSVSMNQDMSVFITNQGNETGYVSELGNVYTLLDAADRPLSWGFLDLGAGWNGEIAPDETRNLVESLRYSGQAEKVKVVTSYENEANASSMRTQGLEGVAADLERLRRREARESAKLERLERLQTP